MPEHNPYLVPADVANARTAVSIVTMRVVHIRDVGVLVSHWLVLMSVCVWLAGRISRLVSVPVVDIVQVRMRMHDTLMNVLVFVTFG